MLQFGVPLLSRRILGPAARHFAVLVTLASMPLARLSAQDSGLIPGLIPEGMSAALDPACFNLLDNGDFQERFDGEDPDRSARVPWWVTRGAAKQVQEAEGCWLLTPVGGGASQPLAAYAPMAQEMRIQGRVRGRGKLELHDGSGEVLSFLVGEPGMEASFELGPEDWEEAFNAPLQPRFELHLSAGDESDPAGAMWTDLQAWIWLPCPDEADLRSMVVECLDHIFEAWLENGRVEGGVFIEKLFDVNTGEPLLGREGEILHLDGGMFPIFPFLLEALRHEHNSAWDEALRGFIQAYVGDCISPNTAFPRRWSTLKGEPIDTKFRELHVDLEFLLDASLHGPADLRAGCLDAAEAMAASILAVGVQPDGAIAASYRASDGAVNLAINPLRRLDVAAQLSRLGIDEREPQRRQAALNAVGVFEFTHYWSGSWHSIDPGFDDDYGHYANRAVVMLDAWPTQSTLQGIVDEGWAHFRPLWRDGLRFGGSVAADQVRCWGLLLRRRNQKGAHLPDLLPLVNSAMRAHFKSQQYRNGAFGDVTFSGFSPKAGIKVGDLPGVPSNLLLGLGHAYAEGTGMDPKRIRAMAATLLHTSNEHYRREHGFLLRQRDSSPAFSQSGGGMRLAGGLLVWLAKLTP